MYLAHLPFSILRRNWCRTPRLRSDWLMTAGALQWPDIFHSHLMRQAAHRLSRKISCKWTFVFLPRIPDTTLKVSPVFAKADISLYDRLEWNVKPWGDSGREEKGRQRIGPTPQGPDCGRKPKTSSANTGLFRLRESAHKASLCSQLRGPHATLSIKDLQTDNGKWCRRTGGPLCCLRGPHFSLMTELRWYTSIRKKKVFHFPTSSGKATHHSSPVTERRWNANLVRGNHMSAIFFF